MKKLFPYLLFLGLIFCTGCSKEESSPSSYTKITKEEKELLIGNWQLSHYSNREGVQFDLIQEGILIHYVFTQHGTVNISNVSSRLLQYTGTSLSMTKSETLNYLFDYIPQWDKEAPKKELLYFRSPFDTSLPLDLEVTPHQLILRHEEGDVFTFRRMDAGEDYPVVSQADKLLVVGHWQLKSIRAFSGAKRFIEDNERLIYHFTYEDKLVIENRSTNFDGVFDRFLKVNISDYAYRYDFAWEKREILDIADLGVYRVQVTDQELVLTQTDGYILKFLRVNQ
ncbi:hypothetical protein ACPDHL_00980 [Myroides sp. C15-4]|uniref:hypothetical protein n=1 Tax=Myroides sp. C15-4 TaxID=3400532 RepID=UPI003D2F6754